MAKQDKLKMTSDRTSYNPNDVAFKYRISVTVGNGITYLNKFYPGWYKRVELATFNMAYHSSSILAHIHDVDDYDTPEYTEWSEESLYAHGFRINPEVWYLVDPLTLQWREAIQFRLARGEL